MSSPAFEEDGNATEVQDSNCLAGTEGNNGNAPGMGTKGLEPEQT
jgi:hypothetical protein